MKPAAQPAQPRNASLAQIHIAKAQLGMTDDTYRAMLWGVARVHSAKDLDHAGRRKVLDHLRASGFKPRPARPDRQAHPGKPHNIGTPACGPLLRKIEALLADEARPWQYGHAMVKQMFGRERLEFCKPHELHKVVAALEIDRRRRVERAAGAEAAAEIAATTGATA